MLSTSSQTSDAIFLSYSRSDQEAARQLRVALEQASFSVFHDEKSIRSGDNWMDRLHQALQHCSAFIVLIGRDGVQRWVLAETQVALIRHFGPHDPAQRLAIFPVVLPTGNISSLPPFLSLLQIQRWQVSEVLPKSFIEALRSRIICLDPLAKIVFEGCPYVGLSAYQRTDAHLYFGRQQETLQALTYLGVQKNADPEKPIDTNTYYCRWLQIEGNSGVGKSSLVNAGMLPLIEKNALWSRTGFEKWKILGPLLPGEKPLQQLAEVIERGLIENSDQRQLKRLYDDLKNDNNSLSLYLRGFKEESKAFLLVIDQFEELFTFADLVEKRYFDQQLANALLDRDCPLFLISTVRIDFLEEFEQLPRLSALYNVYCKRYLLKAITTTGLKEAIEQPAILAGLDISEITTVILHEVAEEPGALPLVENALSILWGGRQGNCLSGDVYRQHGGVAGLLEEQADSLLQRLDREIPNGRNDALELLLALTRVNDEGRNTRRRLSLDEARWIAGGKRSDPIHGQKIIDYLTGHQLNNNAQRHKFGSLRLVNTIDDHYLDLVHETLIRPKKKDPVTGKWIGHWRTLYEYIERNRDRGFYRDQLTRYAQIWKGSSKWWKWWRLASWLDIWHYRKLRPEKNSIEAVFLQKSYHAIWLKSSILVIVFIWIAQAYWWTISNSLPPSYIFTLQKFRLAAWGVLPEPLPSVIDIPISNSFLMGEPNQQAALFLEKPNPKEVMNFGYPPKQVMISKPFALGKYEVTYEQYDYYVWQQQTMPEPPIYPLNPPKESKFRESLPVVNISWLDANLYLKWLSTKTGYTYRLPTEAEWEYSARAGTKTAYWWGDMPVKNHANCANCGSKWDNFTVAPVGSFPPNPFGLYDTAGNVWEFTCSEWSVELTDNVTSCATDLKLQTRITLRGGSWDNLMVFSRSSARYWDMPPYRTLANGFRVLRTSRTP